VPVAIAKLSDVVFPVTQQRLTGECHCGGLGLRVMTTAVGLQVTWASLHRPRPPTAAGHRRTGRGGGDIKFLPRPDVDSPFVCLVLLVHGDTWTYHSAGFDFSAARARQVRKVRGRRLAANYAAAPLCRCAT